MKTIQLWGIALLSLALGIMTYAEEPKDSSKNAYAEIVFVQGNDLLVLRSDGQPISDEPIGIHLYAGDQVQTGSKTSVELVAMPRRSRLRLSENTVVTIGALGGDGSTTLKLLYGRLRSKVEKIAGTPTPFHVVSRSFVAGVRGTDFGCDLLVPRAGETSSAKIYCFEGSVEVLPSTQAATELAEKKEEGAAKEVPSANPPPAEGGDFAPLVVSAGAMAIIDTKGQGKAADVVEKPIDIEIKAFWRANEFTAAQPVGIVMPTDAQELAPGALLDLTPIKKGIKAKNNAMAGAFVLFASGAGLNIASFMLRKDSAKTADGLLVGGAACAAMGLPVMIYSIALNPLKGAKR
jgi:hypothetical protein